MYYRIPNNVSDSNRAYHDLRGYLEQTLTSYIVILVPVYEGTTNAQVFYPKEFEEKNIENFIEEIAKKSSFKNIRIKFDNEED